MANRTVICIALFAAACTQKTAEENLLEDVGPAISWVATLKFAGEDWMSGKVPAFFVRLCVEDAQKAFDKAAKNVDQSVARKALRDELRHQIESSHAASEQLREAVEKNDRQAAARSVDQISSASTALQILQQKESG